ncbi:hypothetical protein DEU56DRAFT_570221 [Suillus clintonianus]|uniref:uncharacterized protein n=1 Tax=Suillus clintonianus TaxID=1904413 RepID=UPI001B86F167|nr:uncharacterized protein DEU56DRAFT_570221 [Suillus clintonianus]KAG2125430.1 hypothetical protein DEU56DRAFT_570221 [Suillus clintonianus]
MGSKILSATSASASSLEQMLQLGSAAVITFEHSFYVFDQLLHLKDQQEYVPSFYVALERYMASPQAIAVRDAVKTAVLPYQEPVGTAVHTHQRNPSNRTAKRLFGLFRRKEKQYFKPPQDEVKESSECSQEMAKQPMDYSGLIETILAITLEHRLPHGLDARQ